MTEYAKTMKNPVQLIIDEHKMKDPRRETAFPKGVRNHCEMMGGCVQHRKFLFGMFVGSLQSAYSALSLPLGASLLPFQSVIIHMYIYIYTGKVG